jgi:hypothetical protein
MYVTEVVQRHQRSVQRHGIVDHLPRPGLPVAPNGCLIGALWLVHGGHGASLPDDAAGAQAATQCSLHGFKRPVGQAVLLPIRAWVSSICAMQHVAAQITERLGRGQTKQE